MILYSPFENYGTVCLASLLYYARLLAVGVAETRQRIIDGIHIIIRLVVVL